ncbi:MAG: hypothetical protein AMXMBFR82_21810 [Candidatus Hydrogenedentota bacterium]
MVRLLIITALAATSFAGEDDYYRIVTLPTPEGVAFEVGGLCVLPDGRVAAAIRKGEVWLVDNAYDELPANLTFKRIASALHEPLGLMVDGDDLLTAQRSEVTRLRDLDSDDAIDAYLTVANGWGITGNYHEYAFGPKRDGQGRLWVMLNQTLGKKDIPDDAWRGWGVTIGESGKVIPMCAGMRSPCGLGTNAEGDMFFTDQQGNWVPAGSLHHAREGAFYGHVDSLKDMKRPESPLQHPGTIPAELPLPEAVKAVPALSVPAVWFPYRKMGMSATDIACDQTGGKFGPFVGQLFVGDFTMAQVNRVFLEKVDGAYQGACFPFRDGFQSAVVRMAWGADGSMFIGETNRGWNSTGRTSYGLERLVWTGETPFEILSMSARPDGFTLRFTKPVDSKSAADRTSYRMSSYTFLYHQDYGSPEIDAQDLAITAASVHDDQLGVDLVVKGLRAIYVHELHAPGLRDAEGTPLLHDAAYYTLNRIPSLKS